MTDYLVFDCETNGFPDGYIKGDSNRPDPISMSPCYISSCRLASIAWKIGGVEKETLIRPNGWSMTEEATNINGLTDQRLVSTGVDFIQMWGEFKDACRDVVYLVGYGVEFDDKVIASELYIREMTSDLHWWNEKRKIDVGVRGLIQQTLKWVSTKYWPMRLGTLYTKLTKKVKVMTNAHNAMYDVQITDEVWSILRKQNKYSLRSLYIPMLSSLPEIEDIMIEIDDDEEIEATNEDMERAFPGWIALNVV